MTGLLKSVGSSMVESQFNNLSNTVEKSLGLGGGNPEKKEKKRAEAEDVRRQEEKERIARVEALEKRRRKNKEKSEKIRAKYGIGHENERRFADHGSASEGYCNACVLS
eukprot:TRINITY_DN3403_c1_g3_i1.p2 TRINITY_DN3403_c1_g3~~TRINITY_DN3403_c1_g3_i1.p2  ORF type:complete len:109 (-),score=30.77 TRINITY_DN3403_c1_g3_i1:142-468(-)